MKRVSRASRNRAIFGCKKPRGFPSGLHLIEAAVAGERSH